MKKLAKKIVPFRSWGGALSGAGQGAALGAALGSVFPVIGNVGGTILGAAGGIAMGLLGSNVAKKRARRLQDEQNKIRWAAQATSIRNENMNALRSDQNELANLELNDESSFMRNGGKMENVSIKGKVKKLGKGVTLLLNESGTTSGTHETGNNIPLKRNGNIVAFAEPGEVIVDNTVLSKRLGFADRYLALEKAKETASNSIKKDINKEQRLLPIYNKQLANKLGAKPFAFNGLDLSNIMGVVGTAGNLLMSNDALNAQEKLIRNGMEQYAAYRPTLLKNYNLNNKLDVSSEISEVNRGYASSISGLDSVDPAVRSALKNTANVSRLGAISKINSQRNNYARDINNQNAQAMFQVNGINAQRIDEGNRYRTEGMVSGLSAMANLKAQRLSNYQGAFAEFNNMIQQNNALESIQSRYKNDIGNDNLPTEYNKLKVPNWLKFGKDARNARRFARITGSKWVSD